MTTAIDERQALSEFAEQAGWQRTERDRVDIYVRGLFHVHVVWRGAGAISGAARYEDTIMLTYTRELTKIRSWLGQ